MHRSPYSLNIVDRIVNELHRIIAERLRTGDIRVLFEGVEAELLQSRLRINALDVCNAAVSDPRLVITERLEQSCRLLTREADALRAVITSVPHIDFRVYVLERYALKVYPGCERRDSHCRAALADITAGLGLDRRELELLEKLFQKGADRHPVFKTPWLYQVRAWSEILRALVEGRSYSFAVMAGTGEGKTEAFLIPLLMYLLVLRARGRRGRVVLLYPRKALATDQLGRIISLVHIANEVLAEKGLPPLRVAILDGDTPHSWWKRGAIIAVTRDGKDKPLSLRIKCISSPVQDCLPSGSKLVPYRRVRCPRCGAELILDRDEVVRLARRDYRWSRDFIADELERVKQGLAPYIIYNIPVREAEARPPVLRCPSCNTRVDYLYLTKSDIAVLKEPDIIVAGIDALGVRLGDPTVSKAFSGVKAVVVDEAHMLTGVTGAHHALIVRRLIHRNREENPVLVLSSATISNPEVIAKLVHPSAGNPVVIDASSENDYRDKRNVTGYNYYLFILPSETIKFDTAATSAAFTLLHSRTRVLVFTESRRDAEDIAAYVVQRGETVKLAESLDKCDSSFCLVVVSRTSGKLREELQAWLRDPDWRRTVVAVDDSRLEVLRKRVSEGGGLVSREEVDYHHAGLVLVTRREVEERFKRGDIRLLAATSTLELGVDIGELDTILLLGFPRVPASFFQRAGRAGRRRGVDTLIVTLLRGSYRDLHYYARIADLLSNPKRYFQVNLDVSGMVDILASHTLMRLLDELAGQGVGYSPATLATLTLATRLTHDTLSNLDTSRLIREYLQGLEKLDVRPLVEAGRQLIDLLARLFERCKELRLVVALSAVLTWPPVDKEKVQSYLKDVIPDAEKCVRSELARVYKDCGYNVQEDVPDVLTLLEQLDNTITQLKRVNREPPPEVIETRQCIALRRFAEAALYTSVLEKLEELRKSVEAGKTASEEDIAPITLDSILAHTRRLYILAGVG